MLTDAVLIKRIDHERCVIIGIVEAKTDQVDLDYEFNRFFLQDKKPMFFFGNPKKLFLSKMINYLQQNQTIFLILTMILTCQKLRLN